jgi:N-glycosylase/DNA lyase
MKDFVLRVDQPLDLPTTLAGGQCFRWRSDDGERWTGVIGDDIVRLRRVPEGVAIESAPTLPAEIAESIAAYLRLDDDLPAIQSRMGSDPHVRRGIDQYPGMRIMRQDPWETLAGFILSSTSNIPRISRTMELLADAFGEVRELDGTVRRHTFPLPGALAEAGEARLRELGCGFRAPYLARAADAIASGDLRLDALRSAPYEEARARLTALHGVGDKIADCAMLFSLERSEAFPTDRWVRRVVVERYGLPEKASYDAVRRWAWDRFGADAGYANQYLFWSVRQATRPGAKSGADLGG